MEYTQDQPRATCNVKACPGEARWYVCVRFVGSNRRWSTDVVTGLQVCDGCREPIRTAGIEASLGPKLKEIVGRLWGQPDMRLSEIIFKLPDDKDVAVLLSKRRK